MSLRRQEKNCKWRCKWRSRMDRSSIASKREGRMSTDTSRWVDVTGDWRNALCILDFQWSRKVITLKQGWERRSFEDMEKVWRGPGEWFGETKYGYWAIPRAHFSACDPMNKTIVLLPSWLQFLNLLPASPLPHSKCFLSIIYRSKFYFKFLT